MISPQTREEELILNIAKNAKTLDDIKGHSAPYDIEMIRELIDVIDNDIARKLQVRQRAVDLIHHIKEEEDMDIKDVIREDEIKQRLIIKYPEMQETIEVLYDYIFDQDTI